MYISIQFSVQVQTEIKPLPENKDLKKIEIVHIKPEKKNKEN